MGKSNSPTSFSANLIRMTQQSYSHQSMPQAHRLRQMPPPHSELTARKMAVIVISALVLPTIVCTLSGGVVTHAVRRRLPVSLKQLQDITSMRQIDYSNKLSLEEKAREQQTLNAHAPIVSHTKFQRPKVVIDNKR